MTARKYLIRLFCMALLFSLTALIFNFPANRTETIYLSETEIEEPEPDRSVITEETKAPAPEKPKNIGVTVMRNGKQHVIWFTTQEYYCRGHQKKKLFEIIDEYNQEIQRRDEENKLAASQKTPPRLTYEISAYGVNYPEPLQEQAYGDRGCFQIPEYGISVALWSNYSMYESPGSAGIWSVYGGRMIIDHVGQDGFKELHNVKVGTIAYILKEDGSKITLIAKRSESGYSDETHYMFSDGTLADRDPRWTTATCHNWPGIWIVLWEQI